MHLLDRLTAVLGSFSRQSLADYCRIETADDARTLVARDGSLVTMLRLDGMRQMLDQEEWGAVFDKFVTNTSPFLENKGHAIQVWFSRDPLRASSEVGASLKLARRAARDAGLDLEDLFAERQRILPTKTVWEGCFLVLWSRAALLSKVEISESAKRTAAEAAKAPLATDAQWMLRAIDGLRERHSSFVERLSGDLTSLGFKVRVLDAHDALVSARGAIYPSMAESGWRPYLPGDKVPARLMDDLVGDVDKALEMASSGARKGSRLGLLSKVSRGAGDRLSKAAGFKPDVSDVLWPTLSHQILTQDAEAIDRTLIRVGDLIFGGVDMTLAPEELRPFEQLLTRLSEGHGIPWRASFLIEGGGLATLALSATVASIFVWASTDTRRVKNAMDMLKAMSLEGRTIVRLRASFSTWAPAGDVDLARKRVSVLQRAIESWGNCQVSAVAGDPLDGVMSSALSMDCASTAPSAAAPIAEAFSLLPLRRPASAWDQGAVVFRSQDGKPYVYHPGSSLQTVWNDLIVAPPGKGKSVLSNSLNLAFILSPKTGKATTPTLPRIGIIEIGRSSEGLVSLCREGLPRERKHEAVYVRLKMSPEFAINPFDTQLGSRFPLPAERAFLVNLVSLLCTPVGEKKPYDGLTGLVGMVIDAAFKNRASDVTAAPYDRGRDRVVDEALDTLAIQLPSRPNWWDVVDALFAKGRIHEASLAQRHALPLLSDLNAAVRARDIEDIYGRMQLPTGETIIEGFQRMISSAVADYPVLAYPTRFDIGGARVCSLDLDEVAPKGGPSAQRQTAIMYMLARHVLARDFFFGEDDAKQFAGNYRGWHLARIRSLREEPKRLCFDEFHRTGGIDAVRDQVKQDMREARKWGIQIVLISQLLEDFDDQMRDQASGVWICGADSENTVGEAVRAFGLTRTSENAIRRDLTGPGPNGGPVLARLSTKDGIYEQLLYNFIGPIELWAFSTTAEDTELRRRLTARVGAKNARQLLANRFPRGTAVPEITRRLNDIEETGGDRNTAEAGVIDMLVNEMIDAVRKKAA